MLLTETELFELLKKELADTYRQVYPSCNAPIELWKGQDIINFQEELMQKVKGRISEKWFYTHIKSKGEKMPRIDMLNMLSAYAGYQDWRDFTNQKGSFTNERVESEVKNEVKPIDEPEKKPGILKTEKKPSKKYLQWTLLSVAISVMIILLFGNATKKYHCCFTDLNGRPPVPNAKLEVKLIKAGESPVVIKCDERGCFEVNSNQDQLQFLVNSPYYKPDTIVRVLEKDLNEEIKLQTNDYALMIHYFSTAKLKDWRQRRLQLEDMIAADAKIFQVYVDGTGMELYNKKEFIDKLTMPLKSLKNIEIIETHYNKNQLSLVRFIQVNAQP
ncbi:MAG TPA: hypothetical protein PLL00_00345 [Bacteroidia bacterium]|jgi:hypothetical protein|nr:hypothetical protein [Bacteroidia bacterium]